MEEFRDFLALLAILWMPSVLFLAVWGLIQLFGTI